MSTFRLIQSSSGLVLLAMLVYSTTGTGQQANAPSAGSLPEPVKLSPQDDHQRLMDLLHITEVRRGRDGNNKDSPFYANYDESKANPYPALPDPLVLKNGKKITKAADWWSQRHPEIVEDFDREVYGRVPKVTPKVTWEVTNTTNTVNGDVPVVTKQLVGTVDNSSYPEIEVKIQLTLTTPANAAGPVPVIMQFGGFGFGGGAPGAGRGTAPPPVAAGPPHLPNALAPPPPPAGRGFGTPGATGAAALGARGAIPPGGPGRGLAPSGPTWQQQVLAKGWGYASLTPGSIQADNGWGLPAGAVRLMD